MWRCRVLSWDRTVWRTALRRAHLLLWVLRGVHALLGRWLDET